MRALALAPLLLLAACGGKPATWSDPALPAMQLHPVYPQLKTLAGEEPQPPAKAAQQELRQLWEAIDAGGSLAARAEKDLREQPDVLWFLVQQAADFDLQHRIRAAWLLGQLGQPEAMVPLLLRGKDESRPEARIWLADALWRLGNDSMLLDLVQQMDRADLANDAGRMAIELLQQAGIDPGQQPTYAQLQDQVRLLFRHWRETGKPQRKASVPLPVAAIYAPQFARRLLSVSEHNLRYADEARFILADAGVLGLDSLRLCLHAEERDLRDLAITTIIYLGRPAAPLLFDVLPLLGDPLLAPTAVRALANMRATMALPRLRSLLDTGDKELRCAAAGALGLLGDRSDIPRLQQLQADEQQDLDLRVQAAFSLGVFETERPAHAFLQQLRSAGKYHRGTLDRLLDQLQQLDQGNSQPR